MRCAAAQASDALEDKGSIPYRPSFRAHSVDPDKFDVLICAAWSGQLMLLTATTAEDVEETVTASHVVRTTTEMAPKIEVSPKPAAAVQYRPTADFGPEALRGRRRG